VKNNTSNPIFYEHEEKIVNFRCEENIFNLSSLKEFERPIASYGFAIKFVCEGLERYTINKKTFNVSPGNYILLNGEKDGNVVVDSQKTVKGMCLNISNDMIRDVVATLQAPDTPISDLTLAEFFYTEHFLENQYNAENTVLGKKLMEIGSKISSQSFSAEEITEDLFYELTERLVADQVQVFKQLQSIPTVKNETRRDLCRKVLIGKDYIDSNFTENLSVAQISKIAGLSEYHFFRLFKQMMGITPYQYILAIRLNTAGKLLKSDFAVSEVAIAMGFADIFTFSKAFKKQFGVAPSSFSKF